VVNIMLEWIRIRDEVTCEVYYKLWDENISKYVIQINEVDKIYKVQILVCFYSTYLNVCIYNCRFVLINACLCR
jgi:arabinogalactan endo-1,4-beta-galactosidase